MKIVIATNNTHKVHEIKKILTGINVELFTLSDLGIIIEIEEDKDTLEGNAFKKAKEVSQACGIPALADDTGLFVDALDGAPGVYSSRYSGENATYDDNCNKLLNELEGIRNENKSAYFKTVVCYYESEDKNMFFNGICKGKIIKEKRGNNGFGYDPLFVPEGFNKTYAEMNDEEKNNISHRGKAFEAARNFLQEMIL